ncbi:transglycosylase domain-containing protein [Halosquirtibacter xylanolyticus]|uniref:transglycosylase domain-containing protein n=1 Tax=Halosquirtibacter xylanolyticus TaxID=3374599 RepID=UPI00374A108A|nr:transglycosylase domain-containing protein [Prolixibacteraceae bacterium]
MKEQITSFKKYIIIFWAIIASGIIGLIIFFYGISVGWMGYMPTLEELENPPNSFASEVYSEDGVLLRKFFFRNRSNVDFNSISPSTVEALVATEDARFFDHSGIDLIGLVRVVKGVVTGNDNAGGGSTLSQQLAKMLFPREKFDHKWQLVIRKFREWVIAVKLERNFTKEEIISMYLNKYDFLNLAVGIKSASRIYFSTTPDKLSFEQSAMLVGMAKNSALYNPLRRPKMVKERRNVVLSQMYKYDFINTTTKDSLQKLPLGLKYQKEDFKEGVGTYFTEYLRTIMQHKKPERKNYASWQDQKFKEDLNEWNKNPLFGWCHKNRKMDGSPYNLYRDGLKIHATLNSKMQKYAEEAVKHHLSKNLQPAFFKNLKHYQHPPFSNDLTPKERERILNMSIRQSERYRVLRSKGKKFEDILTIFDKPVDMSVFTWKGDVDTIMSPLDSIKYDMSFLRSAMMTYDSRSGHIKAYVGGPNYRHFMYDMVKDGKRQVGSTVKPFLYTLAMQNGLTPCTKALNIEYTFTLPDGSTWTPQNAGSERYGENVTLKWGLANSVNNISAWIMRQYNPGGMKEVMKKMGITSRIDAVPSMFLGTTEISIYEMVGAFGCFSNKGIFTKPIFVTSIEDKNGNIVADFEPFRDEAISKNTAYLMINLLQGVINRGTGSRLRWNKEYGQFTAAMAGKTGTTQNHSDGWFMGVTPELVTGIWTGANLRSIHFDNIRMGQGANLALPIYGFYMHKVYDDPTLGYTQDTQFEKPAGFNINIDCDQDVEKEIEEQTNTVIEDESTDFF